MSTYSSLGLKIRNKYTDFMRSKKFSARDVDTFYRLKRNFYRMFPQYLYMFSQNKPDYEIKSLLLNDYSYQIKCVRKYRYWCYLLEDQEKLTEFVDKLDSKQCLQWQEYIVVARDLESKFPFIYKEILKIVNADRQRRLRLKNRIGNILSKGNAYFLTLTFSDESLNNTQAHIRRKYVSELCKSISNDYVGNVDFGKKKGREHYHVVISTDSFKDVDFKLKRGVGLCSDTVSAIDSWSKHGIYLVQPCGCDDKDADSLARYTCKLTNHAIKETTKRNALIYSR